MKKLITLITLILVTVVVLAQPPKFEEVIEVEGATADQLYSRSKEWFADAFKSAQNVVQLDDPVNYKVIGKGNTGMYRSRNPAALLAPPMARTDFSVKIECKDGRYRYTIYDIKEESFYDGQSLDTETFKEIYDFTHPEELNKQRVAEGLKPWSEKRIKNMQKRRIKRYDILVEQINAIEESIINYMKDVDTDSDW